MLPTSSFFPIISPIHSDRSVIDLKNEYSILNKLQSRDVLANFSFELETKLPKINKRLRTINNKENELTLRENKMVADRQMIQYMQKQVDDMRKVMMNGHGHCCCQSQRYPIVIPFQSYQPNQPNQFFSQCQNGPAQNQPPINQKNEPKMSNQSSTQNIGSKQGKKNGRNPGKTFRKYVYAVYFCIYLKYYSMKFTKNRYAFFKNRYLSNNGQKVKEDSYKITKSIEVIDLMKLMVQAPDSIDDNKVSSLSMTSVKSLDVKSIDRIIPSLMGPKFQKTLNFINLYLKQLQKIILSPKFVDFYGQIIGIGTINQSFFMDDLMIPQQIQFITFSEKKGFAKINPETEKVLIMTYMFVKHILFKILLKLRQRKYLENKLKETYSKFQDDKDEMYEFLDMSTAVLYSLVNTIFLDYLQEATKTNYDKLKKRFKISPAKILTAPNCPKELRQNPNLEQLIMGVPKMDEIRGFLQDEKYDNYLGYLVQQIENLSVKLLDRVRYVNKAIYDHIKLETLSNAYIVFEGIKNEKTDNLKSMKTINNLGSINSKVPHVASNSRYSNTSLGMNSKLFNKTKY